MFTLNDFLIRLFLSAIFFNNCCEIHEHVALVSNKAVIGSCLRILTPKFYNFSVADSRFAIV